MNDGPTTTPDVVIFDLDGVIRDWNDAEMAAVEAAAGLDPGTILSMGFGAELGPAVTTGAMTHREWMEEIRRRLVAEHGSSVVVALEAWESNVGLVDAEMLSVLRAVRVRCRAVVLSNGTTRLRRDLHALDLYDEFDEIYNTAELGVAKPDPTVFRLVLDQLRTAPDRTLFIDDLEANVEGARTVGLRAHRHVDRSETVRFLTAHGLAVPGVP